MRVERRISVLRPEMQVSPSTVPTVHAVVPSLHQIRVATRRKIDFPLTHSIPAVMRTAIQVEIRSMEDESAVSISFLDPYGGLPLNNTGFTAAEINVNIASDTPCGMLVIQDRLAMKEHH